MTALASPQNQAVLIERYVAGLPIAEIAEKMGLSEGTAMVGWLTFKGA